MMNQRYPLMCLLWFSSVISRSTFFKVFNNIHCTVSCYIIMKVTGELLRRRAASRVVILIFGARQYKYVVHLHVENEINLSTWDAYEKLCLFPRMVIKKNAEICFCCYRICLCRLEQNITCSSNERPTSNFIHSCLHKIIIYTFIFHKISHKHVLLQTYKLINWLSISTTHLEETSTIRLFVDVLQRTDCTVHYVYSYLSLVQNLSLLVYYFHHIHQNIFLDIFY